MIAVTGASGMNGTELIKRLSARGVAVRALVRNPARAKAIASLPGVEVVTADLAKSETLAAALKGVERAFLTSTSDQTMLEVQDNFIKAAATAGVKHVVKLSGIMKDVASPFRFARMHGELERRLEASGMAWTHLRAGEFMQVYFRQVPTILEKGAMFLPLEQARTASIDVADIAEAAAACLLDARHERQAYALTGPEALTMTEVAERVAKAAGKPVRYVSITPADFKKAGMANGAAEYRMDSLNELFAERRKGLESTVYPTLQDVFGIKPTSFAQFAARYAAVFRGEQPPPTL